MTIYAKIENNKLQEAPINYKTSNGTTILNFNKNVEMMLEQGFYPYDDEDVFKVKAGEKLIENNTIVDNPDWENQQESKELEQFARDFFNTSLGYVRRRVTMQTGESRDFLFDIKPTLVVGTPIITYNTDGSQNVGVLVTEQFLNECGQQIYVDFYGETPSNE